MPAATIVIMGSMSFWLHPGQDHELTAVITRRAMPSVIANSGH